MGGAALLGCVLAIAVLADLHRAAAPAELAGSVYGPEYGEESGVDEAVTMAKDDIRNANSMAGGASAMKEPMRKKLEKLMQQTSDFQHEEDTYFAKLDAPTATQISVAQGPIGPIGKPGPRGAEGPQGPLGNKGRRGPKGFTGSKGEQGDQGLEGRKGATGDKGPRGPKGVTGPRVPSPPYLFVFTPNHFVSQGLLFVGSIMKF